MAYHVVIEHIHKDIEILELFLSKTVKLKED